MHEESLRQNASNANFDLLKIQISLLRSSKGRGGVTQVMRYTTSI